jgi:hypothetical protein
MCVGCRRSTNQRDLVRLIRTTEGHIAIDLSSKRGGRGVYLCRTPACWEVAIKRRALERALRLKTLLPEDKNRLLDFAHYLEQDNG